MPISLRCSLRACFDGGQSETRVERSRDRWTRRCRALTRGRPPPTPSPTARTGTRSGRMRSRCRRASGVVVTNRGRQRRTPRRAATVRSWPVQRSPRRSAPRGPELLLRVDSDSSLASNAAVGRSTLRAGGCHLLDDWRASSFRVTRPSARNSHRPLRQLLSFARPNSNVGSQSEAVVASGISNRQLVARVLPSASAPIGARTVGAQLVWNRDNLQGPLLDIRYQPPMRQPSGYRAFSPGERRTLLKLQRPTPDRELSGVPAGRQLSADVLRDTVGLAFSKR